MPKEPSSSTKPTPDEVTLLREFLEMPLESTDAVFKKFRDLNMPGTIHEKGKGDFQEFLYIPGTRSDRVLLVAHADTYWDARWPQNRGVVLPAKEIFMQDHLDESIDIRNKNGGLGADDRAGCALLYLLLSTGHSILVTNGEEHGTVGSAWLKKSHPEIFGEINNAHCFVIQLDRHGHDNYVHYGKATEGFEREVESRTDYSKEDGISSDIRILCDTVCGVNLSIGYYNEHSSAEYLKQDDWKKTLDRCRTWLKKKETPLPRFER